MKLILPIAKRTMQSNSPLYYDIIWLDFFVFEHVACIWECISWGNTKRNHFFIYLFNFLKRNKEKQMLKEDWNLRHIRHKMMLHIEAYAFSHSSQLFKRDIK